MAEFGASATLSLEIPDSELRAARREIESELGDLEVNVNATTSGSSGRRPTGRRGGDVGRQLRSTNSALDDLDELAVERNNLLRELLDETEQGNRMRGRRGLGGAGGGLLGLLGVGLGAGALGLAGLAETLKDFEWPDVPDVGFPDEIPVDAPDSIPVSAPDSIPVEAPGSIPVTAPFPIPIPVANAVIDVVDTVTGTPSPDPTPGPSPAPSPAPSPGPTPSEDPSPMPGPVGAPGLDPGGTDSPTPTPTGDGFTLDMDELNPNPPPNQAPVASRDAMAVGAGGGLAAGLTAGASRLLPGLDASPAPGRFGVPTPAVPALASATERGREFFGSLAENFPGGDGGGSAPAMSVSPLAAANMGAGGGGGGGDTASAPGNRSTTRPPEVTVNMEVDARDSRGTQEVVQKVQRKVTELEQRLNRIENAGGGRLMQ